MWLLAILTVGYAGNDDKFITYFVADAIAQGNGIENLNGQYLEQSSTFLFTYILAITSYLTGKFTAEIGYFVSVGFYLLCLWPMSAITRRFGLSWGYAVLILASPPVLYWATSGMENSFYLLVTLFGLLACADAETSSRKSALGLVALIGFALPLTRPEGIPVVFCAMAIYVIVNRFRKATLPVAGVAIAGTLAAIGFRLSIGLPLFPLPAYAKTASPLMHDLRNGVNYFIDMTRELPVYTPVLVVAGLAILVLVAIRCLSGAQMKRDAATQPLVVLTLSFAAATTAFVIMAGGDWMPFGRFLTVPVTLICLLLLTQTAVRYRKLVATLMLAVSVMGLWQITAYKFGGLPYLAKYDYEATEFDAAWIDNRNAIHSRDLVFIDALLKEIEASPKQELTLASIQMGMVPYYVARATTKDVKFFDFRGLATIDVHDCAAVTDPFKYNPFSELEALVDCHGKPFDMIFDRAVRNYVTSTEEFGCEMLFKERHEFLTNRFRGPYNPAVFIADCDGVTGKASDKAAGLAALNQ